MEKFSSFITEEVKPYKLLNLIHDTPDDPNKTGDKMVDQFTTEAAALVKANPLGSDPLEKTDCSAFAADFAKFAKGTALYKKKSRK